MLLWVTGEGGGGGGGYLIALAGEFFPGFFQDFVDGYVKP